MAQDSSVPVNAETVVLSTGARIRLPWRCTDVSIMMASFPVPAKNVRGLLPTDKIRPAQMFPGTAVMTLLGIEYRQPEDVEPYNEFAVLIHVAKPPVSWIPFLPFGFPGLFKSFGSYTHMMPVTTQESVDFGVEIWGYPKNVSEVEFEDLGDTRRCVLRSDDRLVLSLEVRKLAEAKTRPIVVNSYTVKDGQLLKTQAEIRGAYGLTNFKGGASFTLGDHPVAEELRRLGIKQKAVSCTYASRAQLIHY